MSTYYFYYERKQRTSAYKCLLNMAVVTAMYFAARHYFPSMYKGSPESLSELMFILDIAVPVILTILAMCFAYFFIKNKAVIISISPTKLSIVDPTFGDYKLVVKVSDIAQFHQSTSAGSSSLDTGLSLINGTYHPLVFTNYYLDRKAFFNALTKANPNIVVPSNPYVFRQRTPKWAQKFKDRFRR